MKFSLRTILIGVGIIAVLLACLVFALRRTDVDERSSGNIVAFRDPEYAKRAAALNFTFTISEMNVEVRGQIAERGRLSENEASFVLRVTGTTAQSFPGFEISMPYTKNEFSQQVESEIDERLGGESGTKVKKLTLPNEGR